MPVWLLQLLGLLGGEAVVRGGSAALRGVLVKTGKDAALRGALDSAATRAAGRIPTAMGRRLLTPQRLRGAAAATGGVLGGAAGFGIGQEAVTRLFGDDPGPTMPYGAESLIGAPAETPYNDLDSLLEELMSQGAEDGPDNPTLETLIGSGPNGRLI